MGIEEVVEQKERQSLQRKSEPQERKLSRDEYIEQLQEVLSDDPLMASGHSDEIIYQIDDLTVYGGFEMGKRGADHGNLLVEGMSRRDLLIWGTVVVPETRTYISDKKIDQFEELGFQRMSLDNNHLVNDKEGNIETENTLQNNQLNNESQERSHSQMIEEGIALFHGSKKSFDHFELQNNPENGTDLGFGVYLTDDQERAELYVGDEGYVYTIDPTAIDGRELSTEEITLTHDQVQELVVSISEKQMAGEEHYPYLLSDYGEPSSETEMDEGNRLIASEFAYNILDSASNDIDIINDLNAMLGREVEETRLLVAALNEQNIRFAVREYAADEEKISKEIIVFDPNVVKILEQKAKKMEPTLQEVIKQTENIYKIKIKSHLDFLLAHSSDIEDFKEKAAALYLDVDFSKKWATYRLLDHPQIKNTRCRNLVKTDPERYNLEQIKERLKQNEGRFSVEDIVNRYEEKELAAKNDFDYQAKIVSWQVDQVTTKGIYVNLDFGVANHGQFFIDGFKVDPLDDGGFNLYVKHEDRFYFINQDNAKRNLFMNGTTLVKQLSLYNGTVPLKKEPVMTELNEIISAINFLADHEVNSGTQLQQLEKKLDQSLAATQKKISELDQKIIGLNQAAKEQLIKSGRGVI